MAESGQIRVRLYRESGGSPAACPRSTASRLVRLPPYRAFALGYQFAESFFWGAVCGTILTPMDRSLAAAVTGAVASVGVALAAAVVIAPVAYADDQADGAFIMHLEKRGVPTGLTNGTMGAKLGHAVCDDIKAGSQASSKVLQIANLNDADEFTVPQAEEIVYWAITDLCPDEMSQRQDHWRDGN